MLRDRGLELSLYDGRYTLPAQATTDPVGLNPTAPLANASDDALIAQIGPTIAGAFHSYLVKDLHVRMDEPYILLADLEDQWRTRLPRGRAIVKAYASGHMIYLGQSMQPFCRYVSDFISKATAAR